MLLVGLDDARRGLGHPGIERRKANATREAIVPRHVRDLRDPESEVGACANRVSSKNGLRPTSPGPDDEGYVFASAHPSGRVVLAGGRDTPEAVLESGLPYCPREAIEAVAADSSLQIGMASRRLSILDLSPAGHQPMCSEDGSSWIVHNGEIYNCPELRDELVGRGHLFRSRTDTEVVLHAYEEWGRECLHRFNGMCGFAILNRWKGRFFLARDRFGVKPCYHFFDGETFLFSSEMKGLLASGFIRPFPEEQAVRAYLEADLTNHGHRTFFRDCRELLPGHFLELDLKAGGFLVQRYYRIPVGAAAIGDRDAVEDFRELFQDCVRKRLISDVPLGSCLSGGLDSSSIVCTLDRLMREEGLKLPERGVQKTFSARYEDKRHDEGRFIHAVSACTETEPHFVFPLAEDLIRELESLIWHQEEPFGTTSIYAQWEVFRLARQKGVKVTLDGQGGDELLGGYAAYRYPYLGQRLREGDWATYWAELRHFAGSGESESRLVRRSVVESIPPVLRRTASRFFHPRGIRVAADGRIQNPFQRMMDRDFSNNPTNLLRYEDPNSMAHSIGSRLPFLDYRLVEFCFRLPDHMKIRRGVTKWGLREAMAEILPEEIRLRGDKVGFSTPEDTWFRGPLRKTAEEIFSSESFLGHPHVNRGRLQKDWSQHLAGTRNRSQVLWRHLNLELWMRAFLDAGSSRWTAGEEARRLRG